MQSRQIKRASGHLPKNDTYVMSETEIAYPSGEERIAHIRAITKSAVPERRSWLLRLREAYLGPGLRVIFGGSGWMLAATLGFYLVLAGLGCFAFLGQPERIALGGTLLCPLEYIVFFAISVFSEEQAELIDLKSTLRYSFRWLVGVRMLHAGVWMILLNCAVLLALPGELFLPGTRTGMVLIGASGTLIFAMLSLGLCDRCKPAESILLTFGIWVSGAFSFALAGDAVFRFLFEAVPLVVHWCVLLGLFAGALRQVERRTSARFAPTL